MARKKVQRKVEIRRELPIQDFGILDFRTSAVITGLMNKPIFGEPVFQDADRDMNREVAFNDLNMFLSEVDFANTTRSIGEDIRRFGS